MYAALSGEVYLAYAGAGERYGGPEKWPRFAGEGKDAPVVVGVRVEVENPDARGIPDGIGYARHPCFVSSFAEVRDGLEELGWHLVLLPGAEGLVEVDGGADEAQVGQRLREITQSLAGGPDFLGVEAEVVGVGEQLLEGEAGVVESACPG